MTNRQRRILFGLWKELSPSFAFEGDEREARIWYANSRLKISNLKSWSEISDAQARRLAREMRRDLGRGKSRGDEPVSANALETIGNLAIERWGAERRHEALMERLKLRPYRHYARLDRITARQSHSLIEELLDYAERKQNPGEWTMAERKARKEVLRARFAR